MPPATKNRTIAPTTVHDHNFSPIPVTLASSISRVVGLATCGSATGGFGGVASGTGPDGESAISPVYHVRHLICCQLCHPHITVRQHEDSIGPVTFCLGTRVGHRALHRDTLRDISTRTREALLIERVNRQQLEHRGMRFVRQPATGGQEREIKNLRVYQFTLYNASGVNLRNSQIQFEFSSDDVQPWVDRPTRSRTALTPVEALSTPPWKTTFRWQIPNLPPRDSVEFSFDVFEPTSEDYEAALYSDLNVVLRKTKGEPERPVLSPAFVVRSLAVTAMVVAIVSFALLQYQKPIEDSHERLLRDAVAVLDEAEKSPTDHERVVKLERALRLLMKAMREPPPVGPPGG